MRVFRSRLRLACIAFAAVVIGSTAAGAAKEQEVSLSGEVAAGASYNTRLRNLPAGATLSLRIATDGEVRVRLLDRDDFRRYPNPDAPLFDGRVAEELEFDVRIRAAGNYYLVIDNREGESRRSFTIDIHARAGTGGSTKDLEAEANEKVERALSDLERFEATLARLFVFDDLRFRIDRCGDANAYGGGDLVVICVELGPMLQARGVGQATAQDVLLFMMLHEVSHVLLEQWGYPFHDNEELVDELTVALLKMFGEGRRARTQAELLRTFDPQKELTTKRHTDDRHPLSVQRARNIEAWLDDPDLARRWQRFLVPHMQTSALEALSRQPKGWTDAGAVEKELARRTGQ